MPAVIQPSPQSMAFTKYGDYPMAGYTGLTDITIPIYTITGEKLSLPVTMSFHASGRMANETNGLLGMRWTLNCGGLVTRTMRGMPDEYKWMTPYVVDPEQVPSFDVLYSACTDGRIPLTSLDKPIYDSEFDMFEYVLPNGKQGHFILKNENGVKVPMLIPFEALRIEMVNASSGNCYIQYITITDIDGTKYIFGKVDASDVHAIETNPEPDKINGILGDVPTAWYLTKMISADGTDEIRLSYNSRVSDYCDAMQSATIYDRIRNSSTDFEDIFVDPYEAYFASFMFNDHFEQTDVISETKSKQMVPTLSAIEFRGGSVSFNYTTVSQIYNNLLLSEMIINRESVPYKKIKFNCVKHAWEPDIYYLNDLLFYGEDQNVVKEKYSFGYYEPDYAGDVESLSSAAPRKDWWGYYSQLPFSKLLPLQNVNIVAYNSPYEVWKDIGFATAVRNGDENAKKKGMLKTITYPTAGQTEFLYEGNRYANVPYYQAGQNAYTLEGPGLRIKEIISKPVQGKNIRKIYTYGAYEDGRGFINEDLRPGTWQRSQLMETEGNAMHFWNSVGKPTAEFPSPQQAGYRTRDYFSDPYISYDFQGNIINYDAVSEYYIEDDLPVQKTKSSYSLVSYDLLKSFIVADYDGNTPLARKFSDPQNAWQKPVLSGKTFYKYAAGQFEVAKSETYQYAVADKDEAWDMPTYLHTNVVYARQRTDWASDQYSESKQYHERSCSVYGYGFRKYKSGAQLLFNTKTEEFTPGGSIKVEKEMEYDPACFLIRSEKITNSKNLAVKTTYSYPHDFPNTSVYQKMVQSHILSPIVENAASTNGSPTKTTITNYIESSSGVFVPGSVEIKNGTYDQEVVASFNRYDGRGNTLEQQKANDMKEVYFWGYKGRYPIAKIVGNRSFDEIRQLAAVDTLLLNNGTDEQIKAELQRISVILRTQPLLMVSSYTYKPLTGMTSETDANGRTTYYEYDVFGRLKLVRDQDQNILKRICYNYAGQAEACQLFYNQQKSQAFTRSNCGPGLTPGSYTYMVPAGKYADLTQAGADALADADMAANGQHQADILGSCLYSSPDVSGYYSRNDCQGGDTPEPMYVYMPAGSYSSSVSVEDAREQAVWAAQVYANLYGTCQGKSEFRVFNEWPYDVALLFTNKVSGEEFYCYVEVNKTDVMVGLLPRGEYQVEIYPGSWDARYSYYFTANDLSGIAMGEITVPSVPVTSSYNNFYIFKYQ